MTIRGRDRIADWIETTLLVRGSRPLGLDPLHGFFEASQGLEPQLVNTGIREMNRRMSLLGDRYPFKIHGEYAVQAMPSACASAYATMLLMAPGGPVREFLGATPDDAAAVIFENVVAGAAARIWGDAGHALRFGWPSEVGRPMEFDGAIRWLAGMIGVNLGNGYRQPRRKDGGVDVVAWRPFADARSGFPVLLIQCTLQENLLAKGMDIDVRLWGSWLAMDVDPTTAIATPTSLPVGTTWNELALKHMVMDRIRITDLVSSSYKDELALEWVTSTLSEVQPHVEEVQQL